jgi:hypothetical protein
VKTREGLFAQLSEELDRYVDMEEQHLLPLLRKHPDTKELAAGALKGTKDLRASLAKLSNLPKDSDAFLAELGELNKGFQQHVRDERMELLPAVLKALSDEEAGAAVTSIETAAADAEQAKRDEKRDERAQVRREAEEAEQQLAAKARRDEKREERAQVKRDAEEAEQAAAGQRAAVRTQKAAERSAREATLKVVDTIERGAASVQDGARQVSASITERAQRVASETRDAMTVYGESTRTVAEDWQAVRASSAVSMEALTEVRTTWTDWLSKTTRLNSEASQQLIQCKSLKDMAELQRGYVTTAMRNWMEASTKVLEVTQHSSKQALRPLDERLNVAV